MIVGVILLGILGDYKFFMLRKNRTEEGYVDVPSVPVEPTGIDESTDLAAAFSGDTEKLIASTALQPFQPEEAEANWARMTSEKCYRIDAAEPLTETRNFLQRTNNYTHSHPDSCSAPYHEMIGTFYRPHEGVGASPKTGMPLPAIEKAQVQMA